MSFHVFDDKDVRQVELHGVLVDSPQVKRTGMKNLDLRLWNGNRKIFFVNSH